MDVELAPFNDPNVRKAFRLMVDRPAMNETVLGGYGLLGNDLFGIFDPDYDHALPQRHQDIAQAKSLLKKAGHENLTVNMITGNIAQGVVSMSTVFAKQASSAGVMVNLVTGPPTTFWGAGYLKVPFSVDFWYYLPYLLNLAENSLTKAPFNEPHWKFAAL
jgi:peptide/nickel transport system substrate-binding protein